MATSNEAAVRRRQVITTFLVQGLFGLAVMLWVTLRREQQTAAILDSLGSDAAILVAIFAIFTAALASLKFELTNLIFVSLVITAFIMFIPILGGVITAWLGVAVVVITRWLSLRQIGPAKTAVPMDAAGEYVKMVPGQFATYGLPIFAASMLYETWGGVVPLSDANLGTATRIAGAGVTLIILNNVMMFMPARAYGYSVRRILKLNAIDCSIYLVTLPYAVIAALTYVTMGWGAVAALAFTGVIANLVARNLAQTRSRGRQLLQRLASLTNIGKTISLRFTTDQLRMTIYTECKNIVDCSLFSIALIDESKDELSFELDVRDGIFLPKERISFGEGLNSWVVKNHEPLLIGSVADERRMGLRSIADTKKTESWLGVPMIARDHVIGVIAVESYKKNAFTQDDLILLTAIANQAAVAIENAQLYGDLEGLTYALEQRVMERTNELRETNLRLLAADRSKNQFLANMSHELRTPLNSVIGFSSVLLENARDSLPPRLYKFLENIHAAGSHLLMLINDILDLSKIEAGKMELRAERFDLRDTLAAVERVMKGFATEANVQITTSVDPDVPRVFLDEGRLKQILFNLLSNAVKFSPDGGPVTISVRSAPKAISPIAVDSIRIDVEDQGIGIHPDEMQRIFEEFYQTEEGRRARRGGTGLGLSLTRNFIEMHHGTIEVRSAPGRGSCFTLYLPVDHRAALPHYPTAIGAASL